MNNNVVQLFKNTRVPDTGNEIAATVTYTDTLGAEMKVLCVDSCGKTSAFKGPKNPALSDKDNSIAIAKYGRKLTKAEAQAEFGVENEYKYA